MENGAALASWATLLADRTRATICLALLDGRAWTAGELARHAGVAVSTATEHLNRLVAGGILAEHRQGRHRYLRLAGPQVATLIEAMAEAAGPGEAAVRSLSAAHRQAALGYARTCYDHLAGTVGVAVADAMTERRLVTWEHGLSLTPRGTDWLATLGIPVIGEGRRPVLRSCMDWTERRLHLGGLVGAALCTHALDSGWVVRIGTSRAVKVTRAGQRAFHDHLGLALNAA